MLVGAHERRSAVGEGETESVRADLTFGVGEPWCEMDVVECPQQGVVAADAVQRESVCVGQHQADRFVGERATQIVEPCPPHSVNSDPVVSTPVNAGSISSSDTP